MIMIEPLHYSSTYWWGIFSSKCETWANLTHFCLQTASVCFWISQDHANGTSFLTADLQGCGDDYLWRCDSYCPPACECLQLCSQRQYVWPQGATTCLQAASTHHAWSCDQLLLEAWWDHPRRQRRLGLSWTCETLKPICRGFCWRLWWVFLFEYIFLMYQLFEACKLCNDQSLAPWSQEAFA